jgi:hypothetical protein
MTTRDNETDGRYRQILSNFGGSGTIQGTEDLPIDPEVADVKAFALAALVGLAALSLIPAGLTLPIPGTDWLVATIENAYPMAGLLIPSFGTAVGLAILLGCLFVTGVVVYLCPDDRTPIGWIRAMVRFQQSPKRLTRHSDSSRTRTQSMVGIKRVLPISGAVERPDGTLVSLVEVEGKDMALPEEQAWETAGKGFEDLADSLDGPFEVFSPARRVDPGRLAKGYVGREYDEDVRNSETLSALVETYQNDLRDEFDRRGTAVRRFYVVVSVSEREVRREDHGLFAGFAEFPYVGGLIRRFGLARREASDAEIETRQKSILSARERAVENAVSSIEGCTTRDVDAEHYAAILQEYWTGIRTPQSGKAVPHNQIPVVTYNDDEDDPEATGGY